MNGPIPALVALEDGTVFRGSSFGIQGEAFGEFVFNTGMTGYQEVLTDPSYCGQIVVMTYPEIGIYGTNGADSESNRVQVAGFVVHRAVPNAFNQRATLPLTDYLKRAGVVGVEGVDTRALTRHIRARGAMRGAISTTNLDESSLVARVRKSPAMLGRNLVKEVSPKQCIVDRIASDARFDVVLVDTGAKRGISRDLACFGLPSNVTRVPHDVQIDELLAHNPHGVVVSNGPGDPAVLDGSISLIRDLLEAQVPVAGICMGHQLLALALGGRTYKMRFGHRGSNHPVKDLHSGRILITTHNHGFAVDPTSLGIPWEPLDAAFAPARQELLGASRVVPGVSVTMAQRLPSSPLIGKSPLGFGAVEVTYLSLNDGTVEGLRLLDGAAFSVQFHPEASPGPHDAKGFFREFANMMENLDA